MDEVFRAIPNLLGDFDDNPELQEAFILAAWRKIAGESLRMHTVPVHFFGKRLVVAVADKMWKRHLELLSGQMIYKLNSMLKNEMVAFIEFRIDAEIVASGQSKTETNVIAADQYKKMALEQLTPNLKQSAGAIKDVELRKKFLLAAGSCLAREERMNRKEK